MSKRKVINILKSYTGRDVKTPSPKKGFEFHIDDDFIQLPVNDFEPNGNEIPEIDLDNLHQNSPEIFSCDMYETQNFDLFLDALVLEDLN